MCDELRGEEQNWCGKTRFRHQGRAQKQLCRLARGTGEAGGEKGYWLSFLQSLSKGQERRCNVVVATETQEPLARPIRLNCPLARILAWMPATDNLRSICRPHMSPAPQVAWWKGNDGCQKQM